MQTKDFKKRSRQFAKYLKGNRPSAYIHNLYDCVASSWARTKPMLRDDLVSRPTVLKLAREYGRSRFILDCGCGDGNFSRLVSPFAKEVIGIDISSRMLTEARKLSSNFANISYVRADILNLGRYIKPETIDLCLALYAVCCIGSKKKLTEAFKQFYSVLKRGAYAIVQIPHPLESYFSSRSYWCKDINSVGSYFNEGRLIRRKLRNVDNKWLLVARYHYSIYRYLNSMIFAGFIIKEIFEPKASSDVIRKYQTLRRESYVPTSLIVLVQKLK
jgi:SAM-dependent methyltransferase